MARASEIGANNGGGRYAARSLENPDVYVVDWGLGAGLYGLWMQPPADTPIADGYIGYGGTGFTGFPYGVPVEPPD